MRVISTYLLAMLLCTNIFGQDSVSVAVVSPALDSLISNQSYVPSNLKADLTITGELSLTWDYDGPTSKGFLVYISRSRNKDFKLLVPDTLPTNECVDFIKQGPTSKSYFLKVCSILPSDTLSDFSNIATIKSRDIVAPEIPDFQNVDLLQRGMFLQWDNSSKDVEFIKIFRKDSEVSEPIIIEVKEDGKNSYIDTSFVSGNWYFYSLMAVDTSGNESKESKVIEVYAEDISPKDGAYNLMAEQTEFGELKLSWDVKNSTAFKFEIFRSVNGKGFEMHQKILAGRNVFFDSQVKKKKVYTYQIRTIYSDGSLSPLSKEITLEFK